MPIFPKKTGQQILCVWLIAAAGLLLKSVVMGTLGEIGTDSDDIMRLVQLRDLYQGQGWYDMHQYRMGPDGGTLMHWSRIVDLPILSLIWVCDLVLPYDMAEKIAYTIWPPISSLFVIWGVLVGVKHLGGKRSTAFAVILLLFLILPHYRFSAGSIDHHNLQLGLLAIVTGYALDPKMQMHTYGLSGAALALSMAVGVEVFLFAGIICAFAAAVWLFKGDPARRGIIGFGAGFSVTLMAAYFGFVSPRAFAVTACDALGFNIVEVGAVGGLGLAAAAFLLRGKSLAWRLGGLAAVGAAVIVPLLGTTQCLANPLDSLPPAAKTLWLDHVIEAQPLFADRSKWGSFVPFVMGPLIVALIVCAFNIYRKARAAEYLLLVALLALSLVLTLYQVRFYVFGGVFSLFVLAPWTADVYTQTRAKSPSDVRYIFALAASIPFVWGFPGIMMTPVTQSNSAAQDRAALCYSDNVIAAVKALPPGRFAITPNGTAQLLFQTAHSALGGNYHRNAAGIVANIDIFTKTPDDARAVLREMKVDYVHMCRDTQESNVLANHNPDGLMAALLEGQVPDYLVPIDPAVEGGAVKLFRVSAP